MHPQLDQPPMRTLARLMLPAYVFGRDAGMGTSRRARVQHWTISVGHADVGNLAAHEKSSVATAIACIEDEGASIGNRQVRIHLSRPAITSNHNPTRIFVVTCPGLS